MDLCNNHLCAFSNKNYIKVYDVSRREARQVTIRKFEDSTGELGDIRQVRVNQDGTLIGILCDIRENQLLLNPSNTNATNSANNNVTNNSNSTMAA